MKILLIGGTGNISTSVTELCLKDGHEVWILTRGQREIHPHEQLHTICCDIHKPGELRRALQTQSFDAAVDFMCFTPEDAQRDFEVLQERIAHFIMISTCTVYQKPCSTYPITEDTPLKNPYNDYAQKKMACEFYFQSRYRENDFPVTIVRPSHTYGSRQLVVGPTMGWQVPGWTLINRIQHGKPVVVHDTGRSLWTATHSDDFAKGLIGLIGNMSAVGHSFHITNDVPHTWNEIMQQYGALLGTDVKIVGIPAQILAKESAEIHRRLYGDMIENAVFDNTKIKRFVPGFCAEITLKMGLERSLNWFYAHPEAQIIDEAYDRWLDQLIARQNF